MVVTLGQQYNTGEKPTVILYTYINRHSGTADKNKTKSFLVHNKICNNSINSAIDLYTTKTFMIKRNTFTFYNKSAGTFYDVYKILLFHGLKIKIITVYSN